MLAASERPPSFSVVHSPSGWADRREWRVFPDHIDVGMQHWNEAKKSPEFVLEYSRRISATEFVKVSQIWKQLDQRLWSHFVEFTDVAFLSDGPAYGLSDSVDGQALRLFSVGAPIKEMMPAIDAVAELVPSGVRPKFEVKPYLYEWKKRSPDKEPNLEGSDSPERESGPRLNKP